MANGAGTRDTVLRPDAPRQHRVRWDPEGDVDRPRCRRLGIADHLPGHPDQPGAKALLERLRTDARLEQEAEELAAFGWIDYPDTPRVRPDGYGRWSQWVPTTADPTVGTTRMLGFFLEYDTGTETVARVAEKIAAYRGERGVRVHSDRHPVAERLTEALPGMVLFWVPTYRREIELRRALWGKTGDLPVATTCGDHGAPEGVAGPVWAPVPTDDQPAQRVRIGQLAAAIGGTEPSGQPSALVRAREHRQALDQAAQHRQRQLDQQRRDAAQAAHTERIRAAAEQERREREADAERQRHDHFPPLPRRHRS